MIKRLLCVLSLAGLVRQTARAQTMVGGQQVITLPVSSYGNTTKALLSLPSNYDSSINVRYPLIIFLHGEGEAGTNIDSMLTDLGGIPYRISQGFVPQAINPVDGKLYKFIVVAPQAPYWSYGLAEIEYMLPAMEATYRVDTTRIYITGLSAGGDQTWTCVTDDPNFCGRIAAIAPMSAAPVNASTELPYIRNAAINHLPVWDICGTADQTGFYPDNVAYVDTLYANNANPYADSTWLYGVGHSAWYEGYNPSWYGRGGHTMGLNVYEWFLQWQRGVTIPWGPGHYIPPPSPASPIASVAQDSISLTLPLDSARVDGSPSTPPTGGAITGYSWSVVSGPMGYTIEYPDSATTEITDLAAGTYNLLLTVTTNLETSATATVTIVVASATTHIPPKAVPGNNITIQLPLDSVALDGSGSTDPNTAGSITSYQWSVLSGPSGYAIANAGTKVTELTGLKAGAYDVRLTVTDNFGLKDSATVTVTVDAASAQHVPPVADPGSNVTIQLPLDSTTLNGSSSSDKGGEITSYHWSIVSGPIPYTLTDSTDAVASLGNLEVGTYVAQLIVTDNTGSSDTASVLVTVLAVSQLPVAIITAPDTLVTLPDSTISLSGNHSYAPIGQVIKSYQWQQLAGPQGVAWSAPSDSSTLVSVPVDGSYLFQLTVTDDEGRTGSSTILITVAADPHESVEIYPNPVQGSLNVSLSGMISGRLTFNIFDMDGRLLQTSTAEKYAQEPLTELLDVVDLAKGAYFLEVLGGKTKIALPFLKLQ